MKRVLILGGGRMGKIIAQDLAKDYDVIIADKNVPIKGFKWLDCDILSLQTADLMTMYDAFDVVVGALPSELGYAPFMAAMVNGTNYVDLSFHNETPSSLYDVAFESKAIGFYDCGVSPGLSNFLLGYLLRDKKEKVKQANIWVGGIAQDPKRPYGYVNTWSTQDLLEMYKRPARLILEGKEEFVKPLYEEYWSCTNIDGIELEGFISDGLRSMLKTMKAQTDTLIEFTVRHPGHLQKVKPLIEDGTFIKEIESKCQKGKDMLLLKVEVESDEYISVIDKAKSGVSAMARTTAYSCAAFVRLILEEQWLMPGIYAPEEVGYEDRCYNFVLDKLTKHGIKFTHGHA